jgi:hypothetical protein
MHKCCMVMVRSTHTAAWKLSYLILKTRQLLYFRLIIGTGKAIDRDQIARLLGKDLRNQAPLQSILIVALLYVHNLLRKQDAKFRARAPLYLPTYCFATEQLCKVTPFPLHCVNTETYGTPLNTKK